MPYTLPFYFLSTKERILILLFILPLTAGLLGGSSFGSQGITAYFGYTILASFCGIALGLLTIFDKAYCRQSLPGYVWPLLALTIFIFIHGIITQTIGIDHYYWLAATTWVWAMHLRSLRAEFIACCYIGILMIAGIESCIVLLQWLHISPVRNTFFSCTGTWDNPNVTALFLAMSLYAFVQLFPSPKKSTPKFAMPALLMIAILLLQCRTAWIATAIILCYSYIRLPNVLYKKAAAIGVFIVFVILLACCFKYSSTSGRIHIWKTSVALIGKKPFTGHGFGLFEKAYNRFTAGEQSPENDHVNMAYNDFIEFGVEGGLPALLLWLTVIITLWKYNHKRKRPVLPIAVFIFIQLVNFGFQAIPVFTLFLLYMSLGNLPIETAKNLPTNLSWHTKAAFGISVIGSVLLFHQCRLGKAFYEKNRAVHSYDAKQVAAVMQQLAPVLTGYASYHEQYGDAFMQMRNYKAAQREYTASLMSSSKPVVFMKCGYCYQQQNEYDSSEYYYTTALNMEPYRLFPHMALLKLYQQKGDAVKTLQKARDILGMPIKVPNEQATEMKAYAAKIIANQYTPNQPHD